MSSNIRFETSYVIPSYKHMLVDVRRRYGKDLISLFDVGRLFLLDRIYSCLTFDVHRYSSVRPEDDEEESELLKQPKVRNCY